MGSGGLFFINPGQILDNDERPEATGPLDDPTGASPRSALPDSPAFDAQEN
jgi:hypothetical protein